MKITHELMYCGIIIFHRDQCLWSDEIFGLSGSNFVGSAIRVILINIKQLTVYRSVGVLIHVQWLPTKAMNIGPPRNNDDSIEHSYIISVNVLDFAVYYI